MMVYFPYCLVALFITTSSLSGQALPQDELTDSRRQELTQRPQSRVIDPGENFTHGSPSKAKIAQKLEALHQRFGFSVYYVAYSGIIGSSLSEKAKDFRDRLLEEGEEGLVFVCESDTKTTAYALTKVSSLPRDGRTRAWSLPDHEVSQVMIDLAKIDDSGLNPEEYLNMIGHSLADGLDGRLNNHSKTSKKSGAPILATITIAVVLIGCGVSWIQTKTSTLSEMPSGPLFPTVEVPNRLGATFGGGRVGEISFKPAPSPSDS